MAAKYPAFFYSVIMRLQITRYGKNFRTEYHISSKKEILVSFSLFDKDVDALLQAVKNLEDIEGRVQGMVRVKGSQCSSLALSVEGQANNLILEATDIDNLCEMYIGWGPFM
jgi:phosphatidylinositol kinase/protein kinase (PI-3  family)